MAILQEISNWLEAQSAALNLHDVPGRRAFIFAAGLDDLHQAIDFVGSTQVFCRNLVQQLARHGALADGRDPLVAVLQAARGMLGSDRQVECDQLIQRWRATRWSTTRFPRSISSKTRSHVLFIVAVVIIGAGSIGYQIFFPPPVMQSSTGDQSPNIQTQGNVTITYNMSAPRLEALAGELAVTKSALKSFFKILEQQQVPLEDLDSTLREIAAQYKELLQRLETIQSEDPQVIDLKTRARQAIEDGEYDRAEELLNQAEARDLKAIRELEAHIYQQQQALETRRISAAETNVDKARLQRIQLQYEKSAEYFRQAAELLPEGYEQDRAAYLNSAGYDFYRIARYDDALPLFEQSLALRREIGDKAGEGATLNNIGNIYRAWGDYETALPYLEQSLTINREIGNKAGEGPSLNTTSLIYKARGDYATALTYLEQSLVIAREIGDKVVEGATLNNLSQIYKARGDYATALSYLKQSLAIQREIGDKAGEGTTLNNLSQIYKARGDYASALRYLEQSLAIQREIGDKAGEATTLNNLAGISRARYDYAAALRYLEQSLAIHREIGDKAGEATTLNNIANIYAHGGDYETALDYLEQSLALQREIGDKVGMCATLFNMGHIQLQNGERLQAMQTWVAVYRMAKSMRLHQALDELEKLAGQLNLPGGLETWERLSNQLDERSPDSTSDAEPPGQPE